MKTYIPKALILTRLVLGLLILVLSCFYINNYAIIAVILLTIGLLTDVFDGIIARHLNVSTQKLRRLDSSVDQLFFILVAVATYVKHPVFFKDNIVTLTILISLEALTYLVSFIKFKKEIATHTIGAKVWTLLLCATLVQVLLQGQSVILFNICFWVGIVTRLEITAIILILKKWTNDVPSIHHAIKLRHNKEIKRHKMFNG
jgi:phosphatidylglycerophosphate synthase